MVHCSLSASNRLGAEEVDDAAAAPPPVAFAVAFVMRADGATVVAAVVVAFGGGSGRPSIEAPKKTEHGTMITGPSRTMMKMMTSSGQQKTPLGKNSAPVSVCAVRKWSESGAVP